MSRKSFEKWRKENPKEVSCWIVWQAACDYQRESDAALCDINYSWSGADVQEAIRANKGD